MIMDKNAKKRGRSVGPVKITTSIRIEPKMLKVGHALAAEDRRSFSDYVQILIEKDAEEKACD